MGGTYLFLPGKLKGKLCKRRQSLAHTYSSLCAGYDIVVFHVHVYGRVLMPHTGNAGYSKLAANVIAYLGAGNAVAAGIKCGTRDKYVRFFLSNYLCQLFLDLTIVFIGVYVIIAAIYYLGYGHLSIPKLLKAQSRPFFLFQYAKAGVRHGFATYSGIELVDIVYRLQTHFVSGVLSYLG